MVGQRIVSSAALTNYPRLEGLEQHKYVIFPFWKVRKSVVGSAGLKSRCWLATFLLEALGEDLFIFSSF